MRLGDPIFGCSPPTADLTFLTSSSHTFTPPPAAFGAESLAFPTPVHGLPFPPSPGNPRVSNLSCNKLPTTAFSRGLSSAAIANALAPAVLGSQFHEKKARIAEHQQRRRIRRRKLVVLVRSDRQAASYLPTSLPPTDQRGGGQSDQPQQRRLSEHGQHGLESASERRQRSRAAFPRRPAEAAEQFPREGGEGGGEARGGGVRWCRWVGRERAGRPEQRQFVVVVSRLRLELSGLSSGFAGWPGQEACGFHISALGDVAALSR